MNTNYFAKEAQMIAPPNRSTNMDHHQATRAMFRRSLGKVAHLTLRGECLDKARECMRLYGVAYNVAAKEYGVGFPFFGNDTYAKVDGAVWVSGGTWSHWPDEVKQAVATFSRMSCRWNDLALDHHKAAGKRTSTFRALLQS